MARALVLLLVCAGCAQVERPVTSPRHTASQKVILRPVETATTFPRHADCAEMDAPIIYTFICHGIVGYINLRHAN